MRIAKYPKYVWVCSSQVTDHTRVYEENPRYLPIWFEDGDVFSLISPDRMNESLRKFVSADDGTRRRFGEWMQAEKTEERIVATLLNRQLTWRGTQLNDRCVAVRHDGTHELIITVSEPDSTQQTLTGEVTKDDSRRGDSLGGYIVTRDMGTAIAHRYGHPLVKRYGDDFYVFIRTGWLFTDTGYGDHVVTGNRADELHNKLDKNNLERIPNQRAQLRQWRQYLGIGVGSAPVPAVAEFNRLQPTQSMRFEPPGRIELPERPPKNTSERDILMEGGRIERS